MDPDKVKTAVRSGLIFMKDAAACTPTTIDDQAVAGVSIILSNEMLLDWIINLLPTIDKDKLMTSIPQHLAARKFDWSKIWAAIAKFLEIFGPYIFEPETS